MHAVAAIFAPHRNVQHDGENPERLAALGRPPHLNETTAREPALNEILGDRRRFEIVQADQLELALLSAATISHPLAKRAVGLSPDAAVEVVKVVLHHAALFWAALRSVVTASR